MQRVGAVLTASNVELAANALSMAVCGYAAAYFLGGYLYDVSLRAMRARTACEAVSDARNATAPAAAAAMERRVRYSTAALARHQMLVVAEMLALWPFAILVETARYWETGTAMTARATGLYTCQAFFYAAGLVELVRDTAAPDRARMLVHHCVTLGLIAYSAWAGLWRVGVAVMAACDACDVALHAGKLFKDVARSERAATASFAVFVALWCVQRLYGVVWLVIVPYVASWLGQASALALLGLAPVPAETGVSALLAALLAALGVLFAWWTLEIARVLVRRLRGGELADVRDAPAGARPHAD